MGKYLLGVDEHSVGVGEQSVGVEAVDVVAENVHFLAVSSNQHLFFKKNKRFMKFL